MQSVAWNRNGRPPKRDILEQLLIGVPLDGNLGALADRLTWMLAHKSLGQISSLRKSDGSFVSVVDWRANQLADALAKRAAPESAEAAAIDRLMQSASRAVEFECALIGVITNEANNHRIGVANADGTVKFLTRREASGLIGRKRGQCSANRAQNTEMTCSSAGAGRCGSALRAEACHRRGV